MSDVMVTGCFTGLKIRPFHLDSATGVLFEYIPRVVGHAIGFSTVYNLTHWVSLVFSPSYRQLSYPKKLQWCMQPGSTIHAMLASYAGVRVLIYKDEPGVLRRPFTYPSQVFRKFMFTSVSYFIQDFVIITRNLKHFGGYAVTAPMLFHHLIAIYGIATMGRTGKCHFFGLTKLLSEVSTIFLNNRTFLTEGSKLGAINNLFFALSFFAFRICSMGAFYKMVVHRWSYDFGDAPKWIKVMFILNACSLDALNLYWWWIIVRKMGTKAMKAKH